jgi:predicted SAM-dependent methyltransferase
MMTENGSSNVPVNAQGAPLPERAIAPQTQTLISSAPPSPPCPCQSGKPFLECHGAEQKPQLYVPPPVLASPTVTRKLDLACGQSPQEGFEGVDIWPKAQHVVNLFKFPWPFEDNSISELHCSHFLEHVPMIEVDELGNQVPFGEGKDLFFAVMDECYRILVPGGMMKVIVPCGRSNRGFQDPTHRRFFVEATFFYLTKEWREANKLDHYNVTCDFQGNVGWSLLTEMNALHPEVQQRRFMHEWNTIIDWIVTLQSKKPAASGS